MKIALVCPYNMFERPGGVQTLVIALAEGLKSRHHEVKIITPRPTGFKGKVPEGYILLGNTTKFNPAMMGTTGAWTFDIDEKEVGEVLEAEKFDVINFHEPWAPILARQILQISQTAHVGTFHANFADSMVAKSIVNMFIPYGRGIGKKMHVFTAVSPAPASVLINKSPNNNRRAAELVKNIKYIPNGVDNSLYKPPKKRTPLSGPGTKTIVYVGRLEKRKGVEWLVKAFKLLSDEMPHAYLLIGGEGGHRSRLEQMVKTYNIPNVNFLGYVTEEQKRHLMSNADVFCAPAMFGESFGIVVIEAMASGAAIIAGRNIGFTTVVSGRGRLGLVDSEATEDFASRLSVFLNDETINRLARQWSLNEIKKYDYSKIVDQYEEAYRAALSQWRADRHLNGDNAKNEKKLAKLARRLSLRRQPR